MCIRVNQNKELVKKIRQELKRNSGYCPCELLKNNDTKCICKDFKNKVENGYKGECNCGLYVSY